MTTDTLLNEPVTIMFADRVKPDKTDEYEAWSTGINGQTKQFPGFLSVDVIRPKESSHPEYITLVKFNNCENLKRWKESSNLAKWLEPLPNLLISDTQAQERVGLELWFDRPNIPLRPKEPPFWKQLVIGAKTERAPILETAGYWRSLRLPTDPGVDVGVGAGNGRIALENRTSD